MPRQWLTDGMEWETLDGMLQKSFAEHVRKKYPNYHNWSIKLSLHNDVAIDAKMCVIRLVNPAGEVFTTTFSVSNDFLVESDPSMWNYMFEKAMAEVFDFESQKGIEHLKDLLNMLV